MIGPTVFHYGFVFSVGSFEYNPTCIKYFIEPTVQNVFIISKPYMNRTIVLEMQEMLSFESLGYSGNTIKSKGLRLYQTKLEPLIEVGEPVMTWHTLPKTKKMLTGYYRLTHQLSQVVELHEF